MLGLDFSNYSSDLTPEALDALKAQGYGFGIVQAVNPPAPYPHTRTRDQIIALLNAGWIVDAYVWLWFEQDDVAAKLGLLSGFEGRLRQLYLDVEDSAVIKYNQVVTETKISDALGLLDQYPAAKRPGIYTGRWYWTDSRYLDNSQAFANRDLWDAVYDNVADTTQGFTPYGGWTSPVIKQFRGTSVVGGISGVDLDVVSTSEVTDTPAPRETPIDYPFSDWRQSAIAYRGALDDMGAQLTMVKATLLKAQENLSVASQSASREAEILSRLSQIHQLSA